MNNNLQDNTIKNFEQLTNEINIVNLLFFNLVGSGEWRVGSICRT